MTAVAPPAGFACHVIMQCAAAFGGHRVARNPPGLFPASRIPVRIRTGLRALVYPLSPRADLRGSLHIWRLAK